MPENSRALALTTREKQMYELGVLNTIRLIAGEPQQVLIVVPAKEPSQLNVLMLLLIAIVMYVICSLLSGNWWQWFIEELVDG